MEANQTLHDFVLNLITDAEARSAFQLDPEGTLHEAGLDDITAADVQDVVPLVVDYTSVHGNVGLDPAAVEADLGTLASDPTDVVGQLQAVTQQLAAATQPMSIDGNLAATGTLAVDSGGLSADAHWGGTGLVSGPGISAELYGGGDTAATLDSGVVGSAADATAALDPTTDAAVGALDNLAGDPVGGGLGAAGSVAGGLGSQLEGPTGLVDSLGVTDQPPVSVPDLGLDEGSGLVGSATGAVDGSLDSVGGGDLLGGDVLSGEAGAYGSADAGAHGTASSGLVDDTTDILF